MKKLLERGAIALMVITMVGSGIILPGQSYNAYATETEQNLTTDKVEQNQDSAINNSNDEKNVEPTGSVSTQSTVSAAAEESVPTLAVSHTELKVGTPVTFTITPSDVPEGHIIKYKFLSVQLTYDNNLYAYEWENRNPPAQGQTDNTFKYTFVCNGDYRLQFAAYEYDENDKFVRVVTYNGSINPRYAFKVNDSEAQTVEEYVDGLAEQAKKLFGNSETPQYDMALWMHDIIVESPYDNSLAYAGPAGVLLRKTGTCESYHRAMEMFFKRVGISCNRAEGGGHVWTRCKLDGEWTMIDATWDACQSTDIVDLKHLYFGCTDEMIANTHSGHSINPNSVCNGYKNNYFIRSGKVEPYLDAQKAAVKESIERGETNFVLTYTGPSYAITDRCIIGEAVANQLNQMDWGDRNFKATLKRTNATTAVIEVYAPIRLTSATAASPINYTGGALTPTVTVRGADGKALVQGQDYTVSYSNNVSIGRGTATITGAGNYTGTLQAEFQIGPKGTGLKKLKKQKKAITVKWGKQKSKMPKSRVTGYQIRYSTSPAFPSGGTKIKTVKKYTKTSCKIKKLSKKTRYYVQVRTYMKTSGGTFYSTWSAAKSVVTK